MPNQSDDECALLLLLLLHALHPVHFLSASGVEAAVAYVAGSSISVLDTCLRMVLARRGHRIKVAMSACRRGPAALGSHQQKVANQRWTCSKLV